MNNKTKNYNMKEIMKTLFAVLMVTLLFSCQEESIQISPDCYRLEHLDIYLEGLPTGNTTVWALTKSGEEVEIACSWADAFEYKYRYNCYNYPRLFGDVYVILRSKNIPCE